LSGWAAAAVSAALPRVVRLWSDVRIMLPGLRDVVETTHTFKSCPSAALGGTAGACLLGFNGIDPGDGFPVTSVLCPNFTTAGKPLGRPRRAGLDGQLMCVSHRLLGRCPAGSREFGHDLGSGTGYAMLVRQHVPALPAGGSHQDPSILQSKLPIRACLRRSRLRRSGAPEGLFHIDGVAFYDKFPSHRWRYASSI